MKISDTAKQTIDSGVKPIVLSCYAVKPFDNQDKVILRSNVSINSIDLGFLSPLEYRFVARRTKQGDLLVEKHIEKLFANYKNLSKKFSGFECVTIPAFPRLLRESRLFNLLSAAFSNNGGVPTEKICIELSSDVFFEDYEPVKKEIDKIRSLGVKIAICEVGDDFCPLTRVANIKPNFVFADSVDVYKIKEESEEVSNLVKFFKVMETEIYSPLIANKNLISKAKSLGFDGCLDNTPVIVGGGNK